MNCLACQGACCEKVAPFLLRLPRGDSSLQRWMTVHQIGTGASTDICRCPELADTGLCSIYEERPEPCRAYEPGSAQCVATVRDRRTRAQYVLIRDEEDATAADLYA